VTDDELLALLGQAYRPKRGEPPPGVLAALREAAAARASQMSSEQPGGGFWHRGWRLAYVAVAALLLLTGSAYAAAAGLPSPVRTAAYAVGLPVTPTDVNDLHTAESRLREALAHHDPGEASRQAGIVRDRLADLGAGARAHERPRVEDLLEQQANLSDGASTTEASAPPEDHSTPTTGEETPSPSTTTGSSGPLTETTGSSIAPSTSEPSSVLTAPTNPPTSSPSMVQSEAGQ
jgi:hypothetical protein